MLHKVFNHLELNQIQPKGWLLDQLILQAEGLTGHLEEVWEDVGSDSGWLGGKGEDWERGPYYLDGYVPLAYYLQDDTMIKKAQKWIEWTLSSQTEDGFFGPPSNDDWWPRMVMLKVLIQYYSFTRDPRVMPFMDHYFRYQLKHIKERPLYNWAKARGAENAYCVLWLYGKTGEDYLLELVHILDEQTYEWGQYFTEFPIKKTTKENMDWASFLLGRNRFSEKKEKELLRDYHLTHIVNIAMGLKKSAMDYRLLNKGAYIGEPLQGIKSLMTYHGRANGIWSGDEHLNGKNPTTGNELCAVVEYMFSLNLLGETFGDPFYFDTLEKMAYNALPATISEDFTTHQYDQQVNQIACTHVARDWHNNSNDANLFGFDPNFGCCTANMHQGWPKFISSLFMKEDDDTLVATVYGPCQVHESFNGIQVVIKEETIYPFEDQVRLHITCEQDVTFKLKLRVPKWAKTMTVHINGNVYVEGNDGYITLARQWHHEDMVTIDFHMACVTSTWFANSVAVERGPLVYALPIQADWKPYTYGKTPRVEPFIDYELYPQSTWNYALVWDCHQGIVVKGVKYHPLQKQPFNDQMPPISLYVDAKKVSSWYEVGGNTSLIPVSPIEHNLSSDIQEIKLIPYGATKLRITQFPWFVKKD